MKEEIIPAFSKVCKWLRNNKLSLNTVKTEFIIIGMLPRLSQLDSSPESTPYAIVVDGQEAKRVILVKYLGLVVDDKLVWDQHIDYMWYCHPQAYQALHTNICHIITISGSVTYVFPPLFLAALIIMFLDLFDFVTKKCMGL